MVGAWFAYGDGVGSNANTTTTDPPTATARRRVCSRHRLLADYHADAGDGVHADRRGEQQDVHERHRRAGQDNTANPTADYTDLWGAGIGLDFNNPGGDAGPAGYFDMTPYSGISFDFSADVLPVGACGSTSRSGRARHRLALLDGRHDEELASHGNDGQPQHVEITWTDVGGPYYLTQQTPP